MHTNEPQGENTGIVPLASDSGVDSGVDYGIDALKLGVVFLGFLNKTPEAALYAAVAAEFGGTFLHHQKARLPSFTKWISEKFQSLPEDRKERFKVNATTDAGDRIFESAWQQAAQAVDAGKIKHIATLLVNGLSSEELQEHQVRWLLRILDQTDDVELIILQAYIPESDPDEFYGHEPRHNHNVRELHLKIFSDEAEDIQ